MEAFVRFLMLGSMCLGLFITATAKAGALPESASKDAAVAQPQNTAEEELVPLPNKFADYDANEDGLLHYEEFAHAIMSVNTISDPSELRGLFEQCDTNGDEQIDEKEFNASPLTGESEQQTQVAQFGRHRRCYWKCGLRCHWFKCKVYCYFHCH